MPFFILNSLFQSYTALDSSLIELNFSLKRTRFSFDTSAEECDWNRFRTNKKYQCFYKMKCTLINYVSEYLDKAYSLPNLYKTMSSNCEHSLCFLYHVDFMFLLLHELNKTQATWWL